MRMKTSAAKSAGQKIVASIQDSRNTVLKLCRQEKAQTPPREALQFLVKELQRLTLEAQNLE